MEVSIDELNPMFIDEMCHINQIGYELRNEIILVQLKYKKVMYSYKTFTHYRSRVGNKLPTNVTGDLILNTFKTLM